MPINPIVKAPRKVIRLPEAAYRDPGSAWFVTVGCHERVRAFENPAFAAEVAAVLVERCAALGAGLDVFCLMPDHAHLVVQVKNPETGLVRLMQDVKSRTTRRWWAHGGAGSLWQRSFHDRGLRGAKAYEDAVRYVLENPVRSGLVEDWADYPWLGGDLIADHGPMPAEEPAPSLAPPPS